MDSHNIPVYKEGPWWGRTRAFFQDPLGFSLRNGIRYGPIFRTPVPFRKVYIITGPEETREVLQSGHFNFVKSPFYKALELALGKGLLTSEGSLWKRQRKFMQPVFYKSALEGLYEAMRTESESYCNSLEARLKNGPVTLDISKEMMKVTASIVLQTLFSSSSPLPRDELYEMMVDLQEYVMMRALRPQLFPIALVNGTHRHRRFLRYRNRIDEALYQMIDQRAGMQDPPHDLLSLMTHARDAETGAAMDRRLVRDELITLFAAGHETSANTMAWTLFLLAGDQERTEKLKCELRAVLKGRMPTWNDLPDLVYTRQILEEGMRLFPPAYAVGRAAMKATTIGGYRIPKDAILFISIYAMHRHPDYWEQADSFIPERFTPQEGRKQSRHPDVYLPFGLGPRKCIGFQFAMMEMQLLLAMLMSRFHFSFPDKQPELQPLITLRAKGGMKMEVGPN